MTNTQTTFKRTHHSKPAIASSTSATALFLVAERSRSHIYNAGFRLRSTVAFFVILNAVKELKKTDASFVGMAKHSINI
jgi:hypothetical protein